MNYKKGFHAKIANIEQRFLKLIWIDERPASIIPSS